MNIRRDWSLGIDTCIWHLRLALAFWTYSPTWWLFFFYLLFAFCIMYIPDVRIYDSDQHGAGYIRFYFLFIVWYCIGWIDSRPFMYMLHIY